MELNMARVHEAVAGAAPDRECIVWRDRRLTWADVTARTRRLANLLLDHGLGTVRGDAPAEPWESGQDHLALYLYNGSEYLEGMIGAYKARVAPFNVNYRYVEAELLYLLTDAQTRGMIYHASFAPRLAAVLAKLPPQAVLLQVDDGSGEPLLPGARDYEAALAAASDAPAPVTSHEDDLY